MTNPDRPTIPYGSWPSTLSADRILAGALRLGSPQLAGGVAYWLEGRPSEGGRQVVVRGAGSSVRSSVGEETDGAEDATPAEWNIRTRVHEYGGGDYRVRGEDVVFSSFADQRAWLMAVGGEPRALTAEGSRYANFAWSPDGRCVAAVEERRDPANPSVEPENRIVLLDVTSSADEGEPSNSVVAAAGHDFFSYPVFSPDGRSLAYTAWDHPRMPWDGTELYVQALDDGVPVGSPERIAGGDDESIFQPRFSPAGVLTFVSDRSGWWNLYQGDRPLCPIDEEFGRPQWVFGMSTWAFIDEGEILCSVSSAGRDRLCRLAVGSGALRELPLPFSNVGGLDVEGSEVCFVAAGPESAAGIYRMSLEDGAEADSLAVLRSSVDVALAPGEISQPENIEFSTTGGRTAHAFFYPPTNARARGPEHERPPLIVKSHGGPTSATLPVLSLSTQYWTSRGFAVVDVNYGGSTGYGRAYRERLRGAWGVVDVEDCVHAARHLAARGDVDPARLAISGGSAGGYTTLCALTFFDDFAAGASHYGIGDLEALARDTHKFESRYTDSLVGPYPEAIETYRARSPIHHTEGLSCPVIFFQGLEDQVVPPNQAEAMVGALAQRGIRHAYVAFEGEQHGFRRAENIRTALEGELWFYGQVFGFEVDVAPAGVEIVG